jgi:hypothetical protein
MIPSGPNDLIAVIVSQATIILVACSVLLGLLRDLYEDRKVRSGVSGSRKEVTAPLLGGQGAVRLRQFLRVFSTGLVLFYTIIAIAVFVVEVIGVPLEDGRTVMFKLAVPKWNSEIVFNLADVHQFELRGHFAIVVIVAAIVACMVRVRHNEARRRWSQQ